jgi:beta-N-acetylhexosaminidase
MSKARSEFLAHYGFDVNFAPVADVAYTAASTMYLRSFGSDPKMVADKVSAVVRGAQALRVMGAAKHFPGHGRTSIDSHFAIPTVDLSFADWKKSDALPFRAAIHAGVEMVMIGHLNFPQWDNKPMSLSKVSVRTLRDELKFDGVIVTDDLGMGALAGMDPLWVLDMAFAAGMDIFLYTMPPLPWTTLVDHLVQRAKRGEISEKRIDTSVRRIVRRKLRHFRLSGKDFAE